MMQVKATEESQRHVARYSQLATRRMRSLTSACLIAVAALTTTAAVQAQAPATGTAQARPQAQALPMIDLTAGMHRIRAQVADSPEERAIGLMHRAEMPANEGMLFIFEVAQKQCFWMKNTLMPLSIAFLADDGRIVNLDEMKANTTDNHCSTAPVRYVLEMNAGWFTKKGLKAGDRIGGGPFKPR
jgi:uncharacterized protein